MAQRTINSPGVEIRESDLSLTAPLNVGTNVYVTGFAQQGPIDEVLKITTKQELNRVFGPPTNSSERYFYYTLNELLNSPANVYASRLPYGAGTGDGFGSKYSALVYPVRAVSVPNTSSAAVSGGFLSGGGVLSGVSTNLTQYITHPGGSLVDAASAVYVLGQPTHLELTEAEYLSGVADTAFTWSTTAGGNKLSSGVAGSDDVFTTIRAASGAGVVVYNKSTSTVNNQFEGFYVGIADNTNTDPGSNFNNILDTKTLTQSAASTRSFTIVPKGVQVFALSASFLTGTTNSVSEVIENFTDFEIDGRDDDDILNVGVFKLRKSIYANEAFKLDYNLEDGIAGSVNYHRTRLNPRGGLDVPFFIENRDDNSRNVVIKVNDNISNRLAGNNATNAAGQVIKRIRVLTEELKKAGSLSATVESMQQIGILSAAAAGGNTDTYSLLEAQLGFADSFYPLGSFSDGTVLGKDLGNIPDKLERALDGVKNDDIYDIDIVCEGGLGTIYAAAKTGNNTGSLTYYDEYAVLSAADGLRTSNNITGTALTLRNHYSTIFNKFEQFVSPPYLGGGRGDCIFIADPLRQIFVQGDTSGKILNNPTKNFQTDIYWPIRHQFANENTSYAATYGNWALIYDSYSGRQVWAPFSGFAGAIMARTDAATFPWFAPAGFTRGLVTFANDIAVNPNQKQRDELYKANINPVAQFPSQGLVVFGQKTLSKKSSAFDRINVRRLFLSLERPTKKVSRFFVFEQNTEFTRTRIVNTLTPIFERAKNNEGLYDYLIVCDERNNTPAVIDANELVVDIYIKPTRTAEFILVNFYATRTDANFEELIGG